MNEPTDHRIAPVGALIPALLACILSARTVAAQGTPPAPAPTPPPPPAQVLVIPVGLRGDPDDLGAAGSMRVAAAVGPDVGVGAVAGRGLAARLGTRPSTGDPMAPLRA